MNKIYFSEYQQKILAHLVEDVDEFGSGHSRILSSFLNKRFYYNDKLSEPVASGFGNDAEYLNQWISQYKIWCERSNLKPVWKR